MKLGFQNQDNRVNLVHLTDKGVASLQSSVVFVTKADQKIIDLITSLDIPLAFRQEVSRTITIVDNDLRIQPPNTFLTDGKSTPLVPYRTRYLKCYIIHDLLRDLAKMLRGKKRQVFSKWADRVMREAMKSKGAGWIGRNFKYIGVRGSSTTYSRFKKQLNKLPTEKR